MNLNFFGADRAVTGSCHCIDINGKRILVDCGLQQGRDEIDNSVFPFNAAEVDAVIVTHAHIDHSGRLPLLYKKGFKGPIYTTRLTAKLLTIMLQDSAHIQESEVQWQNQKNQRAGRVFKEPLYTMEDAMNCMKLVKTYDYNIKFQVSEGVECRFVDAGHLLGSSMVELWLSESGITKKIVFSGDIGNKNKPIIKDPSYIKEADYVVTESTYGDRNHEGGGDYTKELAEILDDTFKKGGNVIIPAFAVGRTQELLFYFRIIKERRLVKSMPDFEVVVDSPLAKEATEIYSGDLTGYGECNPSFLNCNGENVLKFPNLRLSQSTDESRALNTDKTPRVIISASGMCDAGRIRHHLKHNLWRPECTIVFVGFMAPGTFGRMLLDGAEKVKIFGEEIVVRAKIVNFKGLSSHADLNGLKEWLSAYDPKPQHIFVVHGDVDVMPEFLDTLHGMGLTAHAPEFSEVYDLAADKILTPGFTLERKKIADNVQDTQEFSELKKASQKLLEVILHNKGGANRDIKSLTDEIRKMANKWDR